MKKLENMFKRENLQNNSYLVYRMSNNLETPFDVVINENKIKSICQDGNVIISALKKAKNLQIDEEKKLITPIIPTQKNKIIISHVQHGEDEELKQFLLQGIEDNECQFFFDRKNCCRVVFKDEIKTQKFFNWVIAQNFKSRPINAYFEPENLYITFLQNIQEKKHSKHEFSTTSMPYYGGPHGYAPEMYPPMMDPSMNPYFLYPPYGFDPYRFMPPYYTNFFIRKANDNDEDQSDEENDEAYPKGKYHEKKEKHYPKDYDYSSYPAKGKQYKDYDKGYYEKGYEKGYDKNYDKNYYDKGYYGKNTTYDSENKGYDKDKGRNKDYKDKKPYDSKKSHPRSKNKPHTPGQKFYYEPKQVKVDAENFPPLIVKEEKKIEVTVVNPNLENQKEVEKSGSNSYSKKQIVELFKKLKNEKRIVMNPALENPHEDVVHLLEKEGDIRLEFLDPKAVKIPTSTNTTPLMTGMSRPVILEEKKE